VKIESSAFHGEDGVVLTRYEAGDPDGPPIVFLSGLGGGFDIWQPLLERFGESFRLIGWDYRGLYESRTPGSLDSLSVPQQARDLAQLLAVTGARYPVLIGWSMGVQVALEWHRFAPGGARGLVAVHGTAGRPLATAFDSQAAGIVAPAVLAALGKVGRGFEEWGPRLVQTPGVARSFVSLGRALGVMGPELDVEAFRGVADSWTRLDFEVYAETFARLGEHDAWGHLPEIKTPTLLVAGGRDRFTPAHLSERMADRMPDAEVALLPDATHFGLLEAPDAIAEHVADFLRYRLELPA
jgi:pimeloyl-ACP methyl ester carboxylesterase